MTTKSQQFRNRIIGHGEEAPDQLLANPRNWRIHPQAQQDALASVLEEVGWVQEVIVNQRTGFVVDGHLRVAMSISRGEQSIPVTYVDLSPEEEALILTTFDPIAAMAAADKEQLDRLLKDISTDNDAVKKLLADLAAENGLAFGEQPEVEDPGPDFDRAEELREKWGTERGQVWIVGQHRVMCGDSTSAEDVVRLMAGERAGLMATDPPYLVDYQGGNHPQSWSNKPNVKDKRWDEYHDPESGVVFFASFLRVALAEALTPKAAIYQWHANLRQSLVEVAWEQNGLHLHQVIIWVKARPVLTRCHYMWQHEPCLYGWVEGQQPELKPPAKSRTVWEIDQQGDSDGIHPTQKPVEIFTRPIEYHTQRGDLCYDPFLGSGTTLIAAERTGRRCYGMEIEPKYVAVILERAAGIGLDPRLESDA